MPHGRDPPSITAPLTSTSQKVEIGAALAGTAAGILRACQGSQRALLSSSPTCSPVLFLLRHAGMFLPYSKLSLCNFISLQIHHPAPKSVMNSSLFWLTYSPTLLCKQIPVLFSMHWLLLPSLRCYLLFIKPLGAQKHMQTIKVFDGQRTEWNPPSSASNSSGPLQSKSFSVPVQLNTFIANVDTEKNKRERSSPRIMVQQLTKPILIYQVRTALHSLNPSLTKEPKDHSPISQCTSNM